MPRSAIRQRVCQNCGTLYTLGVESTQHKYCSLVCRNTWHYNRWKSNGGRRDKAKVRSYWLKHNYGITTEEFESLLKQQKYLCAICNIAQPMGYGWHIDHSHREGHIRGILCQCCNQALGLFKDNTTTLKKAIQYLEN